MPPRVIAVLLAVLMLWSGLAVTEQRFAEALDLPEQVASLAGDGKRSDLHGSMDDHVVDDQPAQPFGEPALDFAALTGTACIFLDCGAKGSGPPRQAIDSMRAPPHLESLRRPPKSA